MSDYWPERTDFGPLFSEPKARKSDPPTSHAAAQSRGLRGQKLLVYQALADGPAGQTELGQRIGMDAHRVNKRLADLESEGLAAPTGDEVRNAGGCLERVWRRIENSKSSASR
jgi:predicted transcriptional regulator